jgi:hypothetical protein
MLDDWAPHLLHLPELLLIILLCCSSCVAVLLLQLLQRLRKGGLHPLSVLLADLPCHVAAVLHCGADTVQRPTAEVYDGSSFSTSPLTRAYWLPQFPTGRPWPLAMLCFKYFQVF